MRIARFEWRLYSIPLINGQLRQGAILELQTDNGQIGIGEIAPLPGWSRETLEESLQQLVAKKEDILRVDWTVQNYFEQLKECVLFPSVTFGLESAIAQLLSPVLEQEVLTSALLIGSEQEILEKADNYEREGYRSVKVKVSQLTFEEAKRVIQALRERFYLRIDVNRAWNSMDSVTFFAQFPRNAFDYVEEPVRDPRDLIALEFPQPVAIDESFPKELSLEKLEKIPSLKTIIYKPTLQGGMVGLLPLLEWAKLRNIDIVLSSSFESDIGLAHIASIAIRCGLQTPLGIGTLAYLTQQLGTFSLMQVGGIVRIPTRIEKQEGTC